MVKRVQNYRTMGVQHIWVTDPITRECWIIDHASGGAMPMLEEAFTIPGTPVRVAIAGIFEEIDAAPKAAAVFRGTGMAGRASQRLRGDAMPNEAGAKANLDQQLASNTARMTDLVNSQFNVEITLSLVLCFSSPEESCAVAMTRALFAKGTRVLQTAPEAKADGRFHIRVGVKRSIRDAVREDFVADMVHTAAGMNGSYDGWNLLTDEAAEEVQSHMETPDVQHSPAASDNLAAQP